MYVRLSVLYRQLLLNYFSSKNVKVLRAESLKFHVQNTY